MTDAPGAERIVRESERAVRFPVNVGIFTERRKRSWYSPQWAGCCQHVVEVAHRRDAKAAALAEHRARCLRETR